MPMPVRNSARLRKAPLHKHQKAHVFEGVFEFIDASPKLFSLLLVSLHIDLRDEDRSAFAVRPDIDRVIEQIPGSLLLSGHGLNQTRKTPPSLSRWQ